jgi:hypothetical protein
LEQGPFLPGWFELWELYDTWSNDLSVKNALKMNEVIHTEKDDQGRSIAAVKASEVANAEKDDQGRSLVAMKMNEVIHVEKDERGRSVAAVKAGQKGSEASHREKDHLGRSVSAVKGTSHRRKPIRVTDLSTGGSTDFPSLGEASLVLGLDKSRLARVARGERKYSEGHTAVYLDAQPKEDD